MALTLVTERGAARHPIRLGELNAVYLLLRHEHRNFPLYDSAMPASPLEFQLQPGLLDHTHSQAFERSLRIFSFRAVSQEVG